MHLDPREQERLTIFTAAELARRRRSRGRRLNATEAVAVVCDEVLEAAWDGLSLDGVIEAGRRALGPDELMDGVATLVPQVQVEAMFPSGTALVAIDAPFGAPEAGAPGAFRLADGDIDLAAGRRRATVDVRNTGTRPVYVSSHFPLAEVNAALEFDRESARGMRLDVPAGTAVGFAPGEQRTVSMVAVHASERASEQASS